MRDASLRIFGFAFSTTQDSETNRGRSTLPTAAESGSYSTRNRTSVATASPSGGSTDSTDQ